jgi:hypothetical protein
MTSGSATICYEKPNTVPGLAVNYVAWLFSKVNPPQNLDFGLLEGLSLCPGIQRQEITTDPSIRT